MAEIKVSHWEMMESDHATLTSRDIWHLQGTSAPFIVAHSRNFSRMFRGCVGG